MNPAKMKRDLSRVTRRELRKAPNGQAVQVEVASRQAIRDSYPMNTKGESAKDKDLYHKMKYLAAGMTELSFFNAQVNGPNGAGGSIGYDVTNMEKAGEMAKGKDFFLEGIDVIPQPTAAAEAVCPVNPPM